MVLQCEQCGRDVAREKILPGGVVQCDACRTSEQMPEVTPSVDEMASRKKEPIKKREAVKTNYLLSEDEKRRLSNLSQKQKHRPVREWQFVLLLVGVALAFIVWALLILEMKIRSTFLSAMSLDEQRLFAGFFGLISAGLIWVASRNGLKWFKVIAVLVVVGLPLSMRPEVQHSGSHSGTSSLFLSMFQGDIKEEDYFPDHFEDYYAEDIEPMIDENTGMALPGVYSVWIRGMNGDNENAVKSYLKKMSRIRGDVKYYPRKAGNTLALIENSPINFSDHIHALKGIGEVRLSDRSARFVDLVLDHSLFIPEQNQELLKDESNERFIEANYKELCSYDMRRAREAADRLSQARSRDMRGEIVRQLNVLIQEPWGYDIDYVNALTEALIVWAEPNDQESAASVSSVSEAFLEAGKEPDFEWLCFVANSGNTKAKEVLLPYWENNPRLYEDLLMLQGSRIEDEVLSVVRNEEKSVGLRCSGLRILEKIGSAHSIPVLESLAEHQNSDIANLSKACLRVINDRQAKGV